MAGARSVLGLVFLTAVGVGACAAPPAPESAPVAAAPLVRLESFGGVMGLRREILVESDGSFTVRDRREQRETVRTLPPGELQEIEDLVAQLPADGAGRVRPCPDCIQHRLTFSRDGQPRSVALVAPFPPDSPYQALLARLIGHAQESAD